jgi:glucose-1-phosphate thymidylyltransferase
LNNAYIKLGECHLIKLGRGIAWLDTGTPTSLLQAANYIQAVQERQGQMIACPEEYAYRKKWIDKEILTECASYYPEGNEYGDYLRELVG